MVDRPINLCPHEVRAVLDGRQTQLRRIIKPQPDGDLMASGAGRAAVMALHTPFAPGDRLWARESFAQIGEKKCPVVIYRDGQDESSSSGPRVDAKWRSSTQMPRARSRFTLIVESVRVERLQDINEEDAEAEGLWRGRARRHLFWPNVSACRLLDGQSHKDCFAAIWDGRHSTGAWARNDWVCAATFRTIKANIDAGDVPWN